MRPQLLPSRPVRPVLSYRMLHAIRRIPPRYTRVHTVRTPSISFVCPRPRTTPATHRHHLTTILQIRLRTEQESDVEARHAPHHASGAGEEDASGAFSASGESIDCLGGSRLEVARLGECPSGPPLPGGPPAPRLVKAEMCGRTGVASWATRSGEMVLALMDTLSAGSVPSGLLNTRCWWLSFFEPAMRYGDGGRAGRASSRPTSIAACSGERLLGSLALKSRIICGTQHGRGATCGTGEGEQHATMVNR